MRQPRRMAGLGDVGADLAALISLTESAGSAGGITAWLQGQISQFNALPSVVTTLQGVINTLNSALTGVGVVPANVQGFVQAQTDLSQITAAYPAAQSQLGVLGVTLYPALQSGTFGLSTITQLSGQGLDVVSTFNSMQQLFAYRDDARTQLALVAQNSALPVATQQQVGATLNSLSVAASTNATASILGYVAVAAVAYLGFRLVRKIL